MTDPGDAEHNQAVLRRMRAEREARALRDVNPMQTLMDEAWAHHKAQEEAIEELARHCCHRGPGDSDWNLR